MTGANSFSVGDDTNRCLIIRASAGTGKTFQLSNRYLTRLVDGIPPDRILATTFTRNAAAEILERVLKRLATGATGDQAAGELAAEIGRPDLSRQDCVRLITELTRSLHKIRVSTLDSFFVKLAGNFAQELGLPADWSIVDDADVDQFQQRAVERMLQRDSASLLRILNLMQKGETKRSVSQQVLTTVSDLYQHYRISDEHAWRSFPELPLLKRDEIDAAIDSLQNIRTDKSTLEKQRQRCLRHAVMENWGAFVDGKSFCTHIEDGTMTYSSVPIPQDLADAVRPLILHARSMMMRQWASQNIRTWELLDRFHHELNALKHSSKLFQFDDMNHFLQPAHLAMIGPRVQYRMDGRVTNLLLDEFQDTSMSQWHAIRPFAQNSAKPDDPTRSFFCVGDVKQAIYGWRGGDAAIFETIERSLPVKTSSLERSYRSSQVIIDTINALFTGIDRHPRQGNQQEGVEQWLERFEPHTTARELAGYARLVVAPQPREGQKETDAAFEFAAAEIAKIRRRAPGRSIGVLARTKNVVRRMVHELRREAVAASEEGANPLVDSAIVQEILSLFTLADHPSDSVAAFHVSHSLLMKTRLLADFADEFHSRRVSRFLRRHLVTVGYGRTILDIASDLAEILGDRERRRIFQLVELAGEFDQRSSLRPIEFVDFIEQRPVSESSPDLVRVMTIHQSKGLEFDIVVLPELDFGIFQDIKCAWSADEEGRRQAVYIYRNLQLQAGLPPEAQAAFDETYARLTGEGLSLLYVAVTRAVHELQLIVPASSPRQIPQKKTSGYIRAALYGTGAIQPGQELYEHGNVDWSESTPARPTEVEPQLTLEHTFPPKVSLKPMTRRSRGLDRKAPSKKSQRRRLSSLLDSQSEAAMNYGTVIHKWFEQIEWIEDGVPTNDELQNALEDPGLSEIDLDEAVADFRKAIATSQIEKLLSRTIYESSKVDSLTVERERRFTVRIDDALVNGSIDRLVICRKDGQTVAADVIDYKSDKVSTVSEMEQKASDYGSQLDNYRAAVSKLFRLDPARITTRLVFTKTGRVVHVN